MKIKKQGSSADGGHVLSSDLILTLNPRVITTVGNAGDDSSRGGQAHAISGGTIALSTLHAEARELLALADGRRSIGDLIRISGVSPSAAQKHLRSLRDRGILVDATAVAPAPDASGPPSPEESEGESDGEIPDGASALTKAIDEYLELAASALTSSATDETSSTSSPRPGGAGDLSAPLEGANTLPGGVTSLPGMIPGSGTAAGGARPLSPASQSAPAGTFGPGVAKSHQPIFKPNVTAFWIPAMGDGLSPSPSPQAEVTSPSAGGTPPAAGVPIEGSSPSSSAPTVVVGDASGSGRARTDGARQDGVTSSSSAASDGVPSAGAPALPGGAAIPFRVGNYEVATRIAQGGMGSIYVCRRAGDTGFQRLFTLKVVRQHSAKREEAVRSFKREAHVGSLMRHPNLQTVLDVGSYKDQPFLVLDYIEGNSLSELISDERRPPVAVTVATLLDILRGLQHAHELVDAKKAPLGLVHGDVSPQNVLVGVDGAARLTDFGSATFTGEGRVHDPKWIATGKPAYMAPEQLRAEPLDARTDVFAAGVVMWSALTGQKLFAGDTYDETIIKVLRKKIPPPSAFGAPQLFDEICLKALSRSREGRYNTAEEMARDLARVASSHRLLGSPAEVGEWVRRESGEALGEQRRRIQLMFGGGQAPPRRAELSTAKPARTAPATILLDAVHVQRDPRASAGNGWNKGRDSRAAGPREGRGKGEARGEPRDLTQPTSGVETPELGAHKSLPARTISLPALRRAERTFWQTWKVVILSALLALPVTLTLGYFISNLLVPAPRPSPPGPANVMDAATSQ